MKTNKSDYSADSSLGLCLSGGGALGFAHVGAFRAMEEIGIKADRVSGASMGAIMGLLYAQGYTAQEIFSFVEKYKLYNMLNIVQPSRRFFRGFSTHGKVEKVLNELVPHNSFEQLKIPFHVSVTNIQKLEWEVLSEGNLVKLVLASMSIPLVFEPEEINGEFYVDGGVMNNLPVEVLRDHCQRVIGLDVQDIQEDDCPLNPVQMTKRMYGAMMKQMQKHRVLLCDTYIHFPRLGKYDIYDFSKYKEIIQIGYEDTLSQFKK